MFHVTPRTRRRQSARRWMDDRRLITPDEVRAVMAALDMGVPTTAGMVTATATPADRYAGRP